MTPDELRRLLRSHLIHTRDVPNGKDFVFSGPAEILHDALRQIVLIEQASEGGRLRLDFAKVGPFYLLRIVGGPAEQAEIAAFFTLQDEDAR